ncbi:unnamed protein product, partial [Symbiodinium microadriaticum]
MKQPLWQMWVVACGLMAGASAFKVSQDAVAADSQGQAANRSIRASPLVTPSWHPDCMARSPSIEAVKVHDETKPSLMAMTMGEYRSGPKAPEVFRELTTAARSTRYEDLRKSSKISDAILTSYEAMVEQATEASWIEYELWQAAAFRQMQLKLCRENVTQAAPAGDCAKVPDPAVDSFSKPILVDACQLSWQTHHSLLIDSLSQTAFFEDENDLHEEELKEHQWLSQWLGDTELAFRDTQSEFHKQLRKENKQVIQQHGRGIYFNQPVRAEYDRKREIINGTYANRYAYPVYRHLLDTRKATKQKLWKALWEDIQKKHWLGLSPETPFAESCGRAWSTKPSQRHNGTVLSRMLDASRAEKMCESLTICSGYSCKDGGCELFAGSDLSSEEGYDTYVKDMPHSSTKEAYLTTLCPWFMDWHLVEEGGILHPTHRLTFAGSCNVTREYEIAQCAEQQGRVQASCHTFGVWLQTAQTRLARMEKEMAMAGRDAKITEADQQMRYKMRLAENTAQKKVELAQKAAEARNPPFSLWGIVSTIGSLAGPVLSLAGIAWGAEEPVRAGMEAAAGLIEAVGDTVTKYSVRNGEFEDAQHEQEYYEAVSEQITKSEEARMQANTALLHAELDFAKETLGAVGSEISAAQTGTDALCDFFDFSICNLVELIGKRVADQAAFLAALSDKDQKQRFDELRKGIKNETEAIGKDIQGVQEAIEKGMDQISNLTTPLKHAMSDMGASLKSSVDAVATQVNQAVGKVSSDVLRSLEDSRRLLDSKVGNIEAALTSMDKSTTEAIQRTQAKLTSEIKDVQAAVLDGSQRVLDGMEDKMTLMRLEMKSFESSLSDDLWDVQQYQGVLGDMIVGNAMRLDELQSAVDGALALAEEHQLESFQARLSEVLVDMRSALVTALDLEEQAFAAKLAYGRAVQHYSQCKVPWEEVLEKQASMNSSQVLKEPQQFFDLQAKAAASFVKAAQILSAGRVIRRLIEKGILELLPAGLKQDDFTVCREYFSPRGLQKVGEAIQFSASRALTSVSRQLEYLHSLWIRTKQVSARNGAAIGHETTLLTQEAWANIVSTMATVARVFEMPVADKSRGCVSAIVQLAPSSPTTSLVAWDRVKLDHGGELLVVLERAEALLLEEGVHSGWEIDVRKPIPAKLQNVNSLLNSRVFGCKLDKNADGYTAFRPRDSIALSMPDRAFCFCAARVSSRGVVDPECQRHSGICAQASNVALDLWSPVHKPLFLEVFKPWQARFERLILVTRCGDGVQDSWEACDDGNQMDGDGCSSNCKKISPGFTCTKPGEACVTTCGDGILAGAENCDDGNLDAGDGCSPTCSLEMCYRKSFPAAFRRFPATQHIIGKGLPFRRPGHPSAPSATRPGLKLRLEPKGALRAGVPVLAGSASCAELQCPSGCVDRDWKEALLCNGPCGSEDVQRCCTCNSEPSSGSSGSDASLDLQPCFSCEVGAAGSSPSGAEIQESCRGSRAYVFAKFTGEKLVVRHDVVLPSSTSFADALQGSTGRAASVLSGISLRRSKLGSQGFFGLYCPGSADDDCQMWQVGLEANLSDWEGFGASPLGGAAAAAAAEGDVFAIYKVPHHERLWECPKGQEADCGDGMVSGSEECDAGKDIAGCSKCNVLPGWSCDSTGSCSPLCGDGKVEGNEICDDGTDNPWGGCSNDCQYRTHLSYVGYSNSCFGEDVGSQQTRIQVDAASLDACKESCSTNQDCTACEFFPSGWKGKNCYHFMGKIISSLGSGPKWNSAQCFVKVKYALFTEGVESLSTAGALANFCEEKGFEPVSVSAGEVRVIEQSLKELGQPVKDNRGVPIAWASNGGDDFYDLAAWAKCALRREIGIYNDHNDDFHNDDFHNNDRCVSTWQVEIRRMNSHPMNTGHLGADGSSVGAVATKSWDSQRAGYMKLEGGLPREVLSADAISVEIMFKLKEMPNIDHALIFGTTDKTSPSQLNQFLVTVRSHWCEPNLIFLGNGFYHQMTGANPRRDGVCDNKWHRLVVTIKRSSRAYLYVDGRIVAQNRHMNNVGYGAEASRAFVRKKILEFSKRKAQFAHLLFYTRALTKDEAGLSVPCKQENDLAAIYEFHGEYAASLGSEKAFTNVK